MVNNTNIAPTQFAHVRVLWFLIKAIIVNKSFLKGLLRILMSYWVYVGAKDGASFLYVCPIMSACMAVLLALTPTRHQLV